MTSQSGRIYFLLALLAGSFLLALRIFWPFLDTLMLGIVFATVLQPIYQRFLRWAGGRKSIAASGTIAVTIAFIVAPLIFLGIQIFKEAQMLATYLSNDANRVSLLHLLNPAISQLEARFPGFHAPTLDIYQFFKQMSNWLLVNIAPLFGSIAGIVISTLIFLIALYSLLTEGPKLKSLIMELSPLTRSENEAIAERLEMAINVAIKGSLTVAVVQGLAATTGYLIFGLPSAILWGSLTAVAALIPSLGTAIVVGPSILFLLLSGHTVAGIGLLIWGVLAVGLIDNLLYPKLVGKGMQLHPLFILLSVLGGISLFGPIGFVLGPLCISLFFAIFDIYIAVKRKEGLRP